MRVTTIGILVCLALGTAPLFAARDFLTTDEADQIRLLQETNARLAKYAEFARQRVELLEQLLSEEKAGRTTLIHETLEDYTKIIEAIDTVADDALLREVDITEGIAAVIAEEKEFIASLEKIEDDEPSDLARYRFVLENAILATEDSLEINEEDLSARRADVVDREEESQRQLDELMTPESARQRQEAASERAQEEEERRDAPSLYREGEEPQDDR